MTDSPTKTDGDVPTDRGEIDRPGGNRHRRLAGHRQIDRPGAGRRRGQGGLRRSQRRQTDRDGPRPFAAPAARPKFLNVTSPRASVEQVVEAVTGKWGRLDILVNNAGITRDTLIPRMQDSDWDDVINTNLRGTFLFTRAATRAMMQRRYGRIINISSVSGLTGNPGQSNYSASKAGMIGLTRTVAKELAGRKVTVNAIAPGFIESEMTAALGPAILGRSQKADSGQADGPARGDRLRRLVSGQRGGQLYHRPGAHGRWRLVCLRAVYPRPPAGVAGGPGWPPRRANWPWPGALAADASG